eukprot:7976395-Lingulodinium_polyedra.AAC.1
MSWQSHNLTHVDAQLCEQVHQHMLHVFRFEDKSAICADKVACRARFCVRRACARFVFQVVCKT